jgi:hypothetical protein
MTDDEIIVLAADFKSTSMACGVMVDDFDAVGFARAIEQASRRAALEEAAAAIYPHNRSADWTEYAKIRAEAAASIRALATETNNG